MDTNTLPLTRREQRAHAGAVSNAATDDVGARGPSGEEQGRGSTEAHSQRLHIPHISAIDGARGAAILSVLLYHSGWSERGLFGVDMFFVVSGFLITLLLIKEASASGRIRMGAFYARRAKRLLPPLVITLALTLLAVWRWGTLSDLQNAAGTAIASLLQVANWHQIGTHTAYWEAAGQIVPLGQMWSLSVTEQFYIVWPLLIGALWFISRRRLHILVGLLTVALLLAAAVAPLLFDGTNTDRLYLGTDARAVSFIAGGAFAGLVALVLRRKPRWASADASRQSRIVITAVSTLTLGSVIAASVATTSYHESWLYLGGFAGISILIALFIATLCLPGNALVRPFTWKPLRLVGVLAYNMFLLHLPVFWLLQTAADGEMPPLVLFAIGTVLTWLIATVLHYVVTEPLRLRAWRPLGATIAIVTSFALIAAAAWSLPIQRINAPRPAATTSAGDQLLPVNGPLALPEGVGSLRVAVIGDSIAGNMADALLEYRSIDIDIVNVSFGGCGLFDGDATRALDGWITEDTEQVCWPWTQNLQAAADEKPFDVFLVHNRFDAHDQLLANDWVTPGDPAWNAQYRTQIDRLLAIGDTQPQPPQVLLLNDAPTTDFPADRLSARDAQNSLIAGERPTVHLVDYATARCPDATCPVKDANNNPLYTDGTHYAPAGLALLAPWVESQLIQAVSR